jgi:hypothetical protein
MAGYDVICYANEEYKEQFTFVDQTEYKEANQSK